MKLANFATELVQALSRKPIPTDIEGEQDFKRRFLIPLAKDIDPGQEHVLIFSPPFLATKCCHAACASTPPGGRGRVIGCPKCWAAMKPWGSVAAFGTHHTFDLVAKGESQTLAVEVKLVTVHGGRMPNGELQRFLGQCALAATKHPFVIGLFGHHGRLNSKHECDTAAARKWFEGRQIELLFREIGTSVGANNAVHRTGARVARSGR